MKKKGRQTTGRPPTALALAILALLQEEPMHPYEIAFTMRQRFMEETIRLNYGALYATVETLQRAGWITPVETGREGRRPERTVYAITDAGREQFLARLRDLLRRPAKEYSQFEAGLSFIEHLPRAEATALLRERTGELAEDVAYERELYASLQERGIKRLWLVEVEHAIAMHEAELAWTERLATEIASGSLEWPPEAGSRRT
jgi:DNA-binding PadR family transcriptional regulator